MVRDSAAFIGVISHRYGQTPKCSVNNPDGLSISELEFNEAMRLSRPILLFIMGDDHDVKKADIETDPVKVAKLSAFRERAKKMREDSDVERIYQVFNSREEFTRDVAIAIGRLAQALPPEIEEPHESEVPAPSTDKIETALPPNLRAVPRYLGAHDFVGREAELNTLDDWCAAADPHPMLLFEAIGGTGKSMVTWTWMTERAQQARNDWAGRFWFSFYEGGATMERFCREALSYMTGQPQRAFRKHRMRALMPGLIAELEARPWLIVLDGLERILVAYHRIDAPQLRDEDVEMATDQIANRDPRAAIDSEDEELLRLLTAAAPSKLLITSRLTPQALINRAGMPMPGVRREMLRGLRPSDAEALLRACGVSGASSAIQEYLQRNCDCHPLVIGALAGLVNNYMPDRGNFDAWLGDPQAGGKLQLADLNLTQRRSHILDTAIAALPDPDRRLLQTLSLLQGGADYAMLKAFNPHLPTPPQEVKEPKAPERSWDWSYLDARERAQREAEYDGRRKARSVYLEALKAWEEKPEVRIAPARFDETLTELERRGLIQYGHGLKRYDLHPVVRGIAAGRMGEAETSAIGSRVVDYFSNRQHAPFEHAETLEDLALGIQIVATLTRIGNFEDALKSLDGELAISLCHNLMAFAELQRLLQPFFPQGLDGPVTVLDADDQARILNIAANAHFSTNPAAAQHLGQRVLRQHVADEFVDGTWLELGNLIIALKAQEKLNTCARLSALALSLAEACEDDELIFRTLLEMYELEADRGELDRADAHWVRLDKLGRDWTREIYIGGQAEALRARDLFYRGALSETVMSEAEQLCRQGRNRLGVCDCLTLRGEWRLSRDEPNLAIDPLNEALRLYRDAGQEHVETEALLALARLRAGRQVDALDVAERADRGPDHQTALAVSNLWRELAKPERAVASAFRAHKSASGAGEPFVHRYHLDRANTLLRDMGEIPPTVPRHDPANDDIFDWEADICALVEKTCREREELKREKEKLEE